jgi:hypothetical protein
MRQNREKLKQQPVLLVHVVVWYTDVGDRPCVTARGPSQLHISNRCLQAQLPPQYSSNNLKRFLKRKGNRIFVSIALRGTQRVTQAVQHRAFLLCP